MKLPQVTQPPTKPLTRRHNPKPVDPSNYQRYLPCLRWDFGFTCAFCLLHERDFAKLITKRLGIFTVEHRLTQSNHPAERSNYQNCIYSCRLCNRARSDAPITNPKGQVLLDPTTTAWSEHFTAREERLVPHPQDLDAEYTQATYDLNDEAKIELRRKRREVLSRIRSFLQTTPTTIGRLREAASQTQDPSLAAGLLASAEQLNQDLLMYMKELEGYLAIPEDADPECRCGTTTEHKLPLALQEQIQL